MLESPIKYSFVKNIVPFTGEVFFNAAKDVTIGNDLGVYNLLTVELNIKSAISSISGLRIRTSGRNNGSETSQAVVLKGIYNGEEIDESKLFTTPGRYTIRYDISTISEGFFWVLPFAVSAGTRVTDVVDVRLSVQNTSSPLINDFKNTNVLTMVNRATNLSPSPSISTIGRNFIKVDFIAKTNVDTVGHWDYYFTGVNSLGNRAGLLLYNSDGSELNGKMWSSVLNGYYYRLSYGNKISAYIDVRDFDSLFFQINRGGSSVFNIDINAFDVSGQFEIKDVEVWNSKSFILEKTKIVTNCYRDTFAVRESATELSISTTGINGEFKRIALNNTNFPNLIASSQITDVFVLPYTRGADYSTHGREERVVVFTNKGQIYHNYPKRSGNVTLAGDEYLFDQSVVWDLPVGKTSRRHPSNNVSESRSGYQYDPSLKPRAYTYDPPLDTDNGYGNGGFGHSIGVGDMVRPRFYQFDVPTGTTNSNRDLDIPSPFRLLGTMAKSRKGAFFGAYSITRARVCLFASTDGGRNWYVMYEFASNTPTATVGNGNPINLSMLPSYNSGDLSISKRTFIFPDATTKEPTNIFNYGADIVVTNITNVNEGVVTTSTAHGLTTRDIIVFVKNNSSDYDFLTNTKSTTDGGDTGKMYQVEVLSSTTFKLLEYIYSPDNNLTSRHIHYAQLLKDFIAFGTGERYPNGWEMLLDFRSKDGSDSMNLSTTWLESYRLNSSQNSMQRLCGFWMKDDDTTNPTIYGALDEAGIFREKLAIEGRTNLPSRSSVGIFKGKLSDIDDFSKFESVLDIEDVNIYVCDYNGVLVAGFQNGHMTVSLDGGDNWEIVNIGVMPTSVGVDLNNYIYFNNGMRLKLK